MEIKRELRSNGVNVQAHPFVIVVVEATDDSLFHSRCNERSQALFFVDVTFLLHSISL